MLRRTLQVLPFICVLLLPASMMAQDESRALQFQNDLIRQGLMHLPGVEAVAFDVDTADSYIVLYVNQSAARGFQAERLRNAFRDLMDKYKIKRLTEERILEFRALQASPAQMGTSTSNDAGCGAGTLGIAAKDVVNNVTGYITNAHVAAAKGRRLCVNGNETTQVAPARRDHHDCRSTTPIGTLVYPPPQIHTDGVTPSDVDAAFVAEIAGRVSSINACGLCPDDFSIIDPKTAADAAMEVRTCGRGNTTPTTGNVKEATVLAWVRYPCGLRALFRNQILVTGATFTRPGYSGAVAYGTQAGNPKGVLGLIFASDLSAGLTLLNPMQTVLKELKVEIDTSRPCK